MYEILTWDVSSHNADDVDILSEVMFKWNLVTEYKLKALDRAATNQVVLSYSELVLRLIAVFNWFNSLQSLWIM